MKKHETKILYLFGHPGTGKYTISQALSKYGFVVCDNQLINNLIFTLLNYNGIGVIPENGWSAISLIRSAVLKFIVTELNNNYVFTNCLYENQGDLDSYRQIESMALERNSIFFLIKLLISKEENLRRITQPSRTMRLKSIDPDDVHNRGQLLNINHPNLLELDVSNLLADQVAMKILDHIQIRIR